MTHDFFDVDDSYDGVLDQNATHVRTTALSHLRDAGKDDAVLVELPESGGVLVDVLPGFSDVEGARAGARRARVPTTTLRDPTLCVSRRPRVGAARRKPRRSCPQIHAS
jgi:hypothetical protein